MKIKPKKNFLLLLSTVLSCMSYSQNQFENLAIQKLTDLTRTDRIPAKYQELYPNDALQGIMIPSGWGGLGNYLFAVVGGIYPQVYTKNAWDFGSAAGFCFGDPTKLANIAIGINMNDISEFNNFSANLSASRAVGKGSSINAGVLGLFASKVRSDAPEASYFLAFSHAVQHLPTRNRNSSKLSYTIGVGTGRFLLKSGEDSVAGKGEYGTAIFAGISYQVLSGVNLNAEWTGLDLGLSLGVRPFNFPMSFGVGVTNVTGFSSDNPSFIFSIGYALTVNKVVPD